MHAQRRSLCSGLSSLQPLDQQFALFSPWKRSFVSFRCVTGGRGTGSDGRRGGGRRRSRGGGIMRLKGKDNVWSMDNDLAEAATKNGAAVSSSRRRRVRRVPKRGKNSRVIVSGSMLMEIETVLQTQEPVIKPSWNTFLSSVSGIWKGVGAVFSPLTAEMEPIDIGSKNQNLYDCYTLSLIEKVPSGDGSHIRRKINWVTLNPYGEMHDNDPKREDPNSHRSNNMVQRVPSLESFDLNKSEVMEEDQMFMEPGLVFFEDGSYSRGPVGIPVGATDDSKYFLSPTFKFEQCLVKGCHKRLRIVHTIEFKDGGSDMQIIRVAVYEEQWVSCSNVEGESEGEFDLKPFSQRNRIQPSDLAGSWKVFEVSATVIDEESTNGLRSIADECQPSYVYLCMETLKNRSLPENPVCFGEEEPLDSEEVAILWLPGGVTGYVDVKDGILCIGVGWYSAEGINLVMERDYGIDGKLKEVRSKTEVKRRWPDPITL